MSAVETEKPSGRNVSRGTRYGVTREVVALCILWLVVVGPLVQDLTAQGLPRMALTGAIVDDHDIKIDGYPVGFDFTERDGHFYSDKAPGQEVLAVPFYAASRLAGAEAAKVPRPQENLTLWWVTLWTSVLPVVGIILLAAVASRRRDRALPTTALATLAFGTMLLPFSSNLYGHVLAAFLGYAAWVVLDRSDAPSLRVGLSIGALVGAGVLVEYPMAIVGVVIGVALLVRRHWATLAGFALAGVAAAIPLVIYQNAAFGSPFASGYTSKPYHQGASLLITGVPKLSTLAEVLFGGRGLIAFTPVVLVGGVGLVSRWRRTRDEGAMISLAVVAGFLTLQAGWVNPWGGEGPGPRYVIPMLPFLAIGLAEIWRVMLPALRWFVVALSVTSMALATSTFHLMGEGDVLIASHLQHLRDFGVTPTTWSLLLGPAGWAVYALSVAAAGWWWWHNRTESADPDGSTL